MTVEERNQIIAIDYNYVQDLIMFGVTYEQWHHKTFPDLHLVTYSLNTFKDEIEFHKIWLARRWGNLEIMTLYNHAICFVCFTEEDLMQVLGSLTDSNIPEEITIHR